MSDGYDFVKTTRLFKGEDYIPHLLRAQILFSEFSQNIKEKRILEIAPFDGWHTEALLSMGAKHITVIEQNEQALRAFRDKFKAEIEMGKVTVIEGDVHKVIYEMAPKKFDTIICEGFLYHKPHFFWVLEGLARLEAKNILLETFKSKKIKVKALEKNINSPGMRQAKTTSLDYVFVPTEEMFFDSLKKLNYEPIHNLKKKYKKSFVKKHKSLKDKYLKDWVTDQISCWFELGD
ncbi:MAG: class I SAM-dependent methyltransferase [Bdellovibrionales bacterium]|nr:class I SAM-dependent methyltransferase [Bdellovibrionales bacterium]NQZ18330.1 class I SAM-dependent methyltransferase [Bdellovibrionales bacterium]